MKKNLFIDEEVKKIFSEEFAGARITNIKRVCDLVCFTFDLKNKKQFFLHIQCFLRIFNSNGELVICTQNLLDPSPTFEGEDFDWSKIGTTIFDDAIKAFQNKIFDTKVLFFKFNFNDIEITFENEMRMNVLQTSTIYDDGDYSENYRFINDETHYFL